MREAQAWASRNEAELAICHVHPDLFGLDSLYPLRTDVAVTQAGAIDARIAKLVEQQALVSGVDRDVAIFVRGGRPYEEIVRCAKEWSADLVAVGAYDRKGLPRIHLGSVAEQVVRHAACSVLVPRPVQTQGPVVLALDLTPASEVAVPWAVEQARRLAAPLVILNVLHGDEPDASASRALATSQLERLRDTLGYETEVLVVEGSPAEAIVAQVERLGASLVVVGTKGRTGLARVTLGSVAEYVAHAAPCSTLVVRERDVEGERSVEHRSV